MLFKLLAFIVLIVLFLRSIGFLLRFLFGGVAGKATKDFRESRGRKAPGGNVNIEYDPKDQKKKNKGYKGGDYVDYEEVK